MGIPALWQILRKHGLVHELGGDSPDRVVDVANAVAGTVVALDLSMWLMQGMHQPQLTSTYGRDGAPLKVVFDRARTHGRCTHHDMHPTRRRSTCSALACCPSACWKATPQTPNRHSSTPGTPPYTALPVLQAPAGPPTPPTGPCRQRHSACSPHWYHCRHNHAALQHILPQGCPVVQAPGEGEATCAALNAAGYADAVVSFDADALLFGATRVYSSMQLLVNQPRGCALGWCDAREVAALLGLERGGEEALRVAAPLVGGDYEQGGARAVGGERTLQLLQKLCHGRTVRVVALIVLVHT